MVWKITYNLQYILISLCSSSVFKFKHWSNLNRIIFLNLDNVEPQTLAPSLSTYVTTSSTQPLWYVLDSLKLGHRKLEYIKHRIPFHRQSVVTNWLEWFSRGTKVLEQEFGDTFQAAVMAGQLINRGNLTPTQILEAAKNNLGVAPSG